MSKEKCYDLWKLNKYKQGIIINSTELAVDGDWKELQSVKGQAYTCGFCGNKASATQGYATNSGYLSDKYINEDTYSGYGYTAESCIRICPICLMPTFFSYNNKQFPLPSPVNPVDNIPNNDLKSLYDEARRCVTISAYDATVLICRTILMHIAVDNKAKPNESFAYYVNYLDEQHFFPPQAKEWVDFIRQQGNDATHKVELMTADDAIGVLKLTEILLRVVYDFPIKVRSKQNKSVEEVNEESKVTDSKISTHDVKPKSRYFG